MTQLVDVRSPSSIGPFVLVDPFLVDVADAHGLDFDLLDAHCFENGEVLCSNGYATDGVVFILNQHGLIDPSVAGHEGTAHSPGSRLR